MMVKMYYSLITWYITISIQTIAVYTSQYIFRKSNLYKTLNNISLLLDVNTVRQLSHIKMKNVMFTCATKSLFNIPVEPQEKKARNTPKVENGPGELFCFFFALDEAFNVLMYPCCLWTIRSPVTFGHVGWFRFLH